MSKAKTAVSKIVLNLDGKEISLTPAQAKELHDILGELYAPKASKVVDHHHHHHDHWPYRTWYTYTTPTIEPYGTTITFGSASDIGGSISNITSSDTVYLAA